LGGGITGTITPNLSLEGDVAGQPVVGGNGVGPSPSVLRRSRRLLFLPSLHYPRRCARTLCSSTGILPASRASTRVLSLRPLLRPRGGGSPAFRSAATPMRPAPQATSRPFGAPRPNRRPRIGARGCVALHYRHQRVRGDQSPGADWPGVREPQNSDWRFAHDE